MLYGNRNKGYNRRGYSWGKSVRRFSRKGNFKTVAGGSGHRAGEGWGDKKEIDPYSPQRRYSKNSPSFDEGVWLSKQKRRSKQLQSRFFSTAVKMGKYQL